MEDTSATYICFICTKNAKPGACIHDHLWFQLYQSCPGDRVLLRTKPKEKLDEVLALKAALEQTDIRDSMRLLRFYDSCFLGRLVYDLWQFMGVCQRLASQCISGRRMAWRTFRWASNSECFEQNPEEMLHTDAAQVRLQRLRTIVENKKVLGYGLVETLRLQTLRYIHAYIFTRKINKQILYDKLHKKCSAEVQSVVSPRSRMLQGLVGFPARSSSNPCKKGVNRWGRPPGSTRAFSQILSSGWKRGSQS